ncbi:small RNA 2'-O-methyltransferase-like [Pyrus ussuriensis x Pyrus communis]|uniref:Small RNA 2'-O-methyltransferase-like n=1 Tax=Pyrus ussuriensis x Pyrus communis TaxID=2448454 RepID=A0A5N5FXK7_9ROSA|nr:small RNA 2'-O-methyltransferase-like [Pyrus ussuriensis x Pyrus communis]
MAERRKREELGVDPSTKVPTLQEAWDNLVARVSFLFSDEDLEKAFADSYPNFIKNIEPIIKNVSDENP